MFSYLRFMVWGAGSRVWDLGLRAGGRGFGSASADPTRDRRNAKFENSRHSATSVWPQGQAQPPMSSQYWGTSLIINSPPPRTTIGP